MFKTSSDKCVGFLRNKWVRGRMHQWLIRAKLSRKKRVTLSQICIEQEQGHRSFTDSKKRLKWVQTGLAFKPMDQDICTVCPRGMSAHNRVDHAHSMASFQVSTTLP